MCNQFPLFGKDLHTLKLDQKKPCQLNDRAWFYETENITLVYSRDGEVGKDFCQELVGHVYGKIYNLEGGWDAWNSAGFYKETGLNEV